MASTSELVPTNGQNQMPANQPLDPAGENLVEILRKNFVTGFAGLQTTVNVSIKVDQLSEAKSIFDQLKSFAARLTAAKSPAHIDPIECHRELSRIYPNSTQTSFKNSLPLLVNKECLSQDDVNTVLGEVNQSQATMANRMIAISVVLSTVTIICQFQQLSKVWEAIKEARNVVNESRMILNLIRANMMELENGIHDLEGLVNKHELEPVENHLRRDQIIRNIQRKYVTIGGKYSETRLKLSELKIKVDGKLESFEKYQEDKRRGLLMNTVVSATQFVANMAQGWVTGNLGNGLLTTASSVTTTGLAVLTVANVGTIVIGEQMLVELRKLVETVDQMQRNLQPINERIVRIEKWLEENDGLGED